MILSQRRVHANFLFIHFFKYTYAVFFFENASEAKLLDILTNKYEFCMAKSWNFWCLFLHFLFGNGKLWKISKNWKKNFNSFWNFLKKIFLLKLIFRLIWTTDLYFFDFSSSPVKFFLRTSSRWRCGLFTFYWSPKGDTKTI